MSNLYNIPEQQRFADRLVENSFADTVFFCNSGAEAIEGALKVARKYQFANGKPERNQIVCATGSFHGRTLTTLSAGDNDKYREGFGPRPGGFKHVAFGNLNEMRAAMNETTAAILVEPIQGEGGINPATADYLQELRKIADEFDTLLIFDEVQCGMSRSGSLFAHSLAHTEPDIMGLAKGIGGGFPVGAVLATERAAAGMVPGTHGSTYGGNPLAMSVGNAVLDQIFKKGFLKNVKKLSKYFHTELNKIKREFPKIIKDVRGVGFLIGLQLFNDQTKFVQKLMDNKLLTIRAAENVIRILPPLNVKKKEIDLSIKIIRKVCKEYK